MAKTKTFPNAVIYNGVLYPAHTPIEVEEETPKKPTKKAVKKDDNEKAI